MIEMVKNIGKGNVGRGQKLIERNNKTIELMKEINELSELVDGWQQQKKHESEMIPYCLLYLVQFYIEEADKEEQLELKKFIRRELLKESY